VTYGCVRDGASMITYGGMSRKPVTVPTGMSDLFRAHILVYH
jgi:hypothetical protein